MNYPFVNIQYSKVESHDEDRVPLELEVILSYDFLYQKSNTSMPSLSLRIGESRMYYIFHFDRFFKAFEGQDPYVLSSNFSYDAQLYYFSDTDLNLLHLVHEIYELDQLFLYPTNKLIEERRIYVPENYLIRLYSLLRNKAFHLHLNYQGSQHEIYVEGVQPFDKRLLFHLKKNAAYFELTYQFPFQKLSNNFQYLFHNGAVEEVPQELRTAFSALFLGLSQNPNGLGIPAAQMDHFISEVIPYLKEIGDVSLDDELAAQIIEAPLTAEIYLDKKGNHIFATLTFRYENYSIDPFNHKVDPSLPIIFRDTKKEDSILRAFSDFVIKQDGLYLIDEDTSFYFLTVELPNLFEQADIFYTDAFKSIQIQTNPTIRSNVSFLPSENYLEFSFEVDGIDQSELPSLLHALKQKRNYYRLKNGSYIGIKENSISALSLLLDQLQLNHSDLVKQNLKLPAYRAFALDDFSKSYPAFKMKRMKTFKDLIETMSALDETDYECPQELQSILRNYQMTGFRWLKSLSRFGFGGVLADDMGLGKTLQTLAFIVSEYQDKKLPTLIVTPTSLVYNWTEEIHKFIPDMELLVIDGDPTARELLIKDIHRYPIVITSYPLIRRDIELYHSVQFSYCIIDEAQHIKNPKSVNAKAVKQISANGYFALTGTPIENHLTELWSIFDFVMPRLLFSQNKFHNLFEIPIVRDQDLAAKDRLRKTIRPFILRRLKKDVLKELPEKTESKMLCPLLDEQKQLYLAYLNEARAQIRSDLDNNEFKKNQLAILSMITRLRQICCHPAMFIENYKHSSGKMDLLIELIEESIESGHKILLFSQFTSMLGIIREELIGRNIPYAYLDGSIPSSKRKDIIHRFNHEEIPIFLISLKAGGTGLNLTTADLVIHFDPWWNPAVEDQATDRAYRIGQTRNVQVFKFLAKGTIEEKIYELQRRKKELATSIIEDTDSLGFQITEEDIRELFSL